MPQGEIARQLTASFQKFWMTIIQYIRWERLGFVLKDGKPASDWKLTYINIPIEHSVFKALLREAEATTQAGTYKIIKKSFKIMLYDTGKIAFYPSDLPENSARAFLYWLITPPPTGMGLTRVQALYLMSILELFSLEGESPVIGDPYGILPDARIGVTEFDPVPYFGPATIEHFADKSKYKKEIGTRGAPREATDVQEMFAKPVRVEGWIRRIPSAIVGLGEKVNELIRTYNQYMQLAIPMNEVHSDNERHLKRSLRTLGKDLGVHVLLHQESLAEQKKNNKLQRKSNVRLNEIKDAINNQTQEMAELQRLKAPGKRGPYKKPMHAYQVKILKFLEGVPDATLSEVAAEIKQSEGTATYHLKKLIALKLVKKQKGMRMTPPQPKPASQPLFDGTFEQDTDQLFKELDVTPQQQGKGKRGPKIIDLYSKSHNSSSGTP